MNNEFNLIDEKWIPVLTCTGEVPRVGIKDALLKAHDIRDIAASNPMDRIAVLRFLLAVLYWCKGNPSEKDKQVAAFPVDWFAKLEEHRECFNLLGEGRRFYQSVSHRQLPAKSTIQYLLHEVPSGQNFWHFKHVTEMKDGLCPACCAFGLLRLPVFATSGGKGLTKQTGKSPGINGKPPMYIIPRQKTLRETLLALWRESQNLGVPEWEAPGQPLPLRGDVPLLQGLTWPPRQLWLGAIEEAARPCINCGCNERLITGCVFDGKGSTKTEEEGARGWRDPMVSYVEKGKNLQANYSRDALGSADAASAQWLHHIESLATHDIEQGPHEIFGFTTVQNDKYIEASASSSLKIAELPPAIADWRMSPRKAQQNFRRTLEHKPPRKGQHDMVESIVTSIIPHVEHIVSRHPERLLQGGEEGWNKAAKEYEQPLKAAARSLAPDYTAEALLRRAEIERAVPRWSEPKPEGEKPKRKGKKQ